MRAVCPGKIKTAADDRGHNPDLIPQAEERFAAVTPTAGIRVVILGRRYQRSGWRASLKSPMVPHPRPRSRQPDDATSQRYSDQMQDIMAELQIRLYQDSDYEKVREIFADGITEHTAKAFHFSLRLPRIWAVFFMTFLLFSQITGSLLVSLLAVIIDIGLLFLIHKYIYVSYVQYSLEDDMLDIRKYYLQRDGYCFWVAESSGEVAGMVAAVPPNHPGGERQVELKRMSVPRKYRGKGIAKALCRTLIDFARKRGCEAVILETSYPQVDAWQMYEKIGFRRRKTFLAPGLVAKLIGFTILFYQYDLPIHR